VLAENYLQHASTHAHHHAYREQLQQPGERSQRQWPAHGGRMATSAMSSVTTAGTTGSNDGSSCRTGQPEPPPRQQWVQRHATKAIGRTPIAGPAGFRSETGDRIATHPRPPQGQARTALRVRNARSRPNAAELRKPGEQRRRDSSRDRRSTSNRNSCVVRCVAPQRQRRANHHPAKDEPRGLTRAQCLSRHSRKREARGRNPYVDGPCWQGLGRGVHRSACDHMSSVVAPT